MFLAVWMIYAADRLLDARLLDGRLIEAGNAPADLEPRHHFHHAHRTPFVTAIGFGSIALAALLHRLDPRSLHLYALLATLLAAWMVLIHVRPDPNGTISTAAVQPRKALRRPRRIRLPKELAVGIFFPAAVFIPTVARSTASPAAIHLLGWLANWIRPNLLPSAILFAAVCTLNCLCLYAWEHPTPRAQNSPHTDDLRHPQPPLDHPLGDLAPHNHRPGHPRRLYHRLRQPGRPHRASLRSPVRSAPPRSSR